MTFLSLINRFERAVSKNANKKKLSISSNEIHLWFCHPEELLGSPLLEKYRLLLTKKEQERQQRFFYSDDRHNALITRAFVRSVLSHYEEIAPNAWLFSKDTNGKPNIINSHPRRLTNLKFNLSHTKDFILCGITLDNDIGVDVEYCQRKKDMLHLSQRFFSSAENEALNSLSQELKKDRFFTLWTLKEAYVKACGLGLSVPLQHFSFHSLSSNGQNTSISFNESINDSPNNWLFWTFSPTASHKVAIALNYSLQQRPDVKIHRYTPLQQRIEIDIKNWN